MFCVLNLAHHVMLLTFDFPNTNISYLQETFLVFSSNIFLKLLQLFQKQLTSALLATQPLATVTCHGHSQDICTQLFPYTLRMAFSLYIEYCIVNLYHWSLKRIYVMKIGSSSIKP